MSPQNRSPAPAAKVTNGQFEPTASDVPSRRIDTAMLFSAGPEIVITHGHETYRLRLTRQNRLILTK